jgi:FKBP-type peptidyl-prolyl cis-trans isomerase
MKISPTILFITALALTFIYSGCDDPTNPFFRETDFSTVPDPIDFSGFEPVEKDNGLVYYTIEEGKEGSQFSVVSRDAVQLFITLRTKNGDILQSTYANGRTAPENVSVNNLTPRGLREGIIGMKEEEIRVLIVPPGLGFANVGQQSQFYAYREDTLVIEIELVRILQTD